jgi:hypothetical protein
MGTCDHQRAYWIAQLRVRDLERENAGLRAALERLVTLWEINPQHIWTRDIENARAALAAADAGQGERGIGQ